MIEREDFAPGRPGVASRAVRILMDLALQTPGKKRLLAQSRLALVWLAAATIFGNALKADPPARRSPDEVLVVYNLNSPVSVAIAHDYQDRRLVKKRCSHPMPGRCGGHRKRDPFLR